MKINKDTLRETLILAFEKFAESREEAQKTIDYYHNRQYTDEQKVILSNRGQPIETFNVIKLFSRMLIGYYSTVLNTIQAKPQHEDDILTATVLNDVISYILNQNKFNILQGKIELEGMLTGLMCVQLSVAQTKQYDLFKRVQHDIKLSFVPSKELLIDPEADDDLVNYRFIHRFKWFTAADIELTFGKGTIKKLNENIDFINIDYSDVNDNKASDYFYSSFGGRFKVDDNYLIVHSIIRNDKNELEEVFWHDQHILYKTNLTKQGLPSPYQLVQLIPNDKAEYYGIFHEVLESQNAINQALIKIQLLVNTNRAFVEEEAVESLANFAEAFDRVNAVIPVVSLQGIRIESMTQDVVSQYQIIDKALERIKQTLGVNDSFLGQAYASDSGRKVKLQQQSSIVALDYVTKPFTVFHQNLGEAMLTYIKKYYTANRVLRLTDPVYGDRWIEINKPLTDEQGNPQYTVATDDNFEPMLNDKDKYDLIPLHYAHTDFRFTNFDIEVELVPFNDEDERSQLMLETFMNGAIGQSLLTVNPAGFFKIASMTLKNFKTKYSPEVAAILKQTAEMLQPQPQMQGSFANTKGQDGASGQGYKDSPMSGPLKLPTNTNEGM